VKEKTDVIEKTNHGWRNLFVSKRERGGDQNNYLRKQEVAHGNGHKLKGGSNKS